MRRSLPLVLLLLAACGTPQERCIQSQTRDLRTVDRLITETRRNIDRGYATEEYTISVPDWEPCPGQISVRPNGTPRPVQMCLEDHEETRTRPVAIDLNVESAKLQSLLAKREQLAQEANPRIAQCRELHPE